MNLDDYLPLDAEETEEELFDHHRLVADPGQRPERVDKFVMVRLPRASRTSIQLGIEAHFVKVNGLPTKNSYKIKPGDVVTVSLPQPPQTHELLPENIPLDIIYEDTHLLIVNKPAGMVVHPAHGNWTGTLVNALVYYLDTQLAQGSAATRPGLVHRIDKDTSGLLVIAKDDESLMRLARQFYNHTTHRRYLALCWGVPNPAEGTINANLGRSPRDRRVVEVKPATEGKHAITHYRVLEDFIHTALIECRLETGRTHQIRAHMKHLGHPLFADAAYEGNRIWHGQQTSSYKAFVENAFKLCPRQALHAAELGFEHPATGETMRFAAPLPPDMAALVEKWRARV